MMSVPEPSASPSRPCPLCGGLAGPGGETFLFAEIWAALEAEFGVSIPQLTRQTYAPQPTTRLAPCSQCGLRFFCDAVPGGPDFYALLDAQHGYYNRLTWEGRRVARLLAGDDDVVDFGCGSGALLRALKSGSGRRVGVDSNPSAIGALRHARIEAHLDTFENFARSEVGRFDVALAMQVAEHLPDVSELMRAGRRVLRSDGRLLLAVPNADRIAIRFEPMDCPPHHLSRWRVDDLSALARVHGFELVRVECERAYRPAVRRAVTRRVGAKRVGRALSQLTRLTPPVALRFLAARLAPDDEALGHTMLAELRPSREAPPT